MCVVCEELLRCDLNLFSAVNATAHFRFEHTHRHICWLLIITSVHCRYLYISMKTIKQTESQFSGSGSFWDDRALWETLNSPLSFFAWEARDGDDASEALLQLSGFMQQLLITVTCLTAFHAFPFTPLSKRPNKEEYGCRVTVIVFSPQRCYCKIRSVFQLHFDNLCNFANSQSSLKHKKNKLWYASSYWRLFPSVTFPYSRTQPLHWGEIDVVVMMSII